MQIGESLLHVFVAHYVNYLLRKDKNKLFTLAPKYAAEHKMDANDLVDSEIRLAQAIDEIRNKMLATKTIQHVARELKLGFFLLSNIEITERPEEDDTVLVPRTPAVEAKNKRQRKRQQLSYLNVPDANVFETNKEHALASHAIAIETRLLYATLGALYSNMGIEKACIFFNERVLPKILQHINEQESIDYVNQVIQMIDSIKAVAEFRLVHTREKRTKFIEAHVGLFIGSEMIDSERAESFLHAKEMLAKRLYNKWTQNPLELEKLKQKRINASYIASISKIMSK